MDIWFTLFVTLAALLAATGFSLLMIGYINSTLASFQYGWRNWSLVLLLPFVGGALFCYRNKSDHLKTGRQLLAGLLCLVSSLGLIYGAGPAMVRYVASNLQAEANSAAGSVSTPPAASSPSQDKP